MGVLRLQYQRMELSKKSKILTDHAWCEQKAATNAITIITNNSEHQDLVQDLWP
jgi:tRNA-(ms[2]io[6]A)-hydroxylase